ncbi:hypothetical protein G6F62_014750 [Rhizopus arrhizus]|nr:hypothetical protein G6F62_014750 [Rhizopus arrhizus]
MIDCVKHLTTDLSAPGLGVVPLDQGDRVEIVRGSGSVQYGGGTTGGVVNIITKSDFSKEPVTARATATFGSYGLRHRCTPTATATTAANAAKAAAAASPCATTTARSACMAAPPRKSWNCPARA